MPDGARSLFTLCEIMERFKVVKLIYVIERLNNEEHRHFFRCTQSPPVNADKESRLSILELLSGAKNVCEDLHLPHACQKIDNSIAYFKEEGMEINSCHVETELRNVREIIDDALQGYQFIKIASERARYIEKPLLGLAVQARFNSAIPDIFEAKNCLMAGCDTAAVFHLMRVVEWGLRAFCEMVGLDELLTNKRTVPPQYIPVEFGQWEQILNQLPVKIDELIARIPKGPEKQDSQQFYYVCLQEITALKEAWRNHVMHSRAQYGPADSNQVLSHVRRLMERLSSKTGELGYEDKA
jgi:hypothetical protein